MEAWEVLGGEMVGITVVLVEVKMVVAGGVVGLVVVEVCDSVKTESKVSKAAIIFCKCCCVVLADSGHMV